jgi:putative membrane protein
MDAGPSDDVSLIRIRLPSLLIKIGFSILRRSLLLQEPDKCLPKTRQISNGSPAFTSSHNPRNSSRRSVHGRQQTPYPSGYSRSLAPFVAEGLGYYKLGGIGPTDFGGVERMTNLLVTWLLSAASLLIVAYVVKGFDIRGFGSALLAAVVIGLVNGTIGFFLKVVTFPLTILTLGLFWWVINALMLKLAAALVPGFKINGFLPALVGALATGLSDLGLHRSIFLVFAFSR